MSEWARKRFWKQATVASVAGGHAVALDGRPLRTPAKAALVVPSAALARAIAAEWDAVGEVVDPGGMPLTRTANSAIDKVAPERDAVVALLAAYGETDLLCYRADGPADLCRRQTEAWDPWLDWAARHLGAELVVVQGLMPAAQPVHSLSRLSAAVAELDHFRLAAFHDLVALSGSLILALAASEGALSPVEAWRLSRLDEDWQAELWGEDDEAARTAGIRKDAFLQAARFLDLLCESGNVGHSKSLW